MWRYDLLLPHPIHVATRFSWITFTMKTTIKMVGKRTTRRVISLTVISPRKDTSLIATMLRVRSTLKPSKLNSAISKQAVTADKQPKTVTVAKELPYDCNMYNITNMTTYQHHFLIFLQTWVHSQATVIINIIISCKSSSSNNTKDCLTSSTNGHQTIQGIFIWLTMVLLYAYNNDTMMTTIISQL